MTIPNRSNRLAASLLSLSATMLVASVVAAPAFAQQQAPYVWRNVVINGGGFISGIVFSSAQKDLVYARTDVGGAYRSDDAGGSWRPITDSLGRKDSSLTGIESIATDPQNPDKVYLAGGMYSADWGGPSAILRSSNKGRSWARTAMPFKMGGNDDGRNCGEKLAVDPGLGSVLFFGSRHDGMWKSADSGVTWAHVDSFPVKDRVSGPWEKVGISFVAFDSGKATKGTATPTIYAGVGRADANLYRSDDGGASWALVPGTPKDKFPSHAVFASDGQAYFTFINNIGPNGITDGSVLRFTPKDGKWADISPVKPGVEGLGKFGFGGITVDATHPGTLMVTTLDRWYPADGIYRTTDGGKHWKELNSTAAYSAQATPWVYWHKEKPGGTGWMSDIKIDPFNPAKVLYTTGGGIWGSADVTAADKGATTHWGFPNVGIEEVVPISLISPPEGAHLLSGVGDIGGFRHDDMNVSPADGFFSDPQYSNADSLDFATQKPLFVVRSGRGDAKLVRAAYSKDGGGKWTAFASEPPSSTRGGGHLALSADAAVAVWTPDRGKASWTEDFGKKWTECTGLADGAQVFSDRVNPKRFYSFDPKTAKLSVSQDKARTFTEGAVTIGAPGRDWSLAVAPGMEGDLWIGSANMLFRSTDGGTTFAPVEEVGRTFSIGFGKEAPGKTYPTLFLTGEWKKTDGIYRSEDVGKTWTRIDDPAHQYGWIKAAIGDPRIYGRIYLATGGRGIVYGDIATPRAPRAASEVAPPPPAQ